MALTTGTSYFLQAEEGGNIKIGGTRGDSRKRPYGQLFDGGRQICCIGVSPLPESSVQEMFVDHRVRGDWFEPAQRLIQFIAAEAEQTNEERAAFRRINFRKPSATPQARPVPRWEEEYLWENPEFQYIEEAAIDDVLANAPELSVVPNCYCECEEQDEELEDGDDDGLCEICVGFRQAIERLPSCRIVEGLFICWENRMLRPVIGHTSTQTRKREMDWLCWTAFWHFDAAGWEMYPIALDCEHEDVAMSPLPLKRSGVTCWAISPMHYVSRERREELALAAATREACDRVKMPWQTDSNSHRVNTDN